MLGGVGNTSYKVLELDQMDACMSIFNMVNSGEALSLNIFRMKQLIAIE